MKFLEVSCNKKNLFQYLFSITIIYIMALSKGFLRPKLEIDKYTLVNGLFLWTVLSLVLFYFFYFLRESIRYLCIYFVENQAPELSPKEYFYYNLFFASISAIAGFYVFVKFCVENNFSRNSRRTRIRQRYLINDLGFVGWTFLNTFLKFGSVIAISYLTFYLAYEIEFLYDYALIMVLTPTVLFLNPWTTIVRLYGIKAYKWMILSLLYISVLSLIYSNVPLFDDDKLQTNLKNESIESLYQIELPRSLSFETNHHKPYAINLYLLLISENEPRLFMNDPSHELKIDQLAYEFEKELTAWEDYEKRRCFANLLVDKNVPLKYVNQIRYQLRKANMRKIVFSTGRKFSKYPSDYPPFKHSGIKMSLHPAYYPEFEHFLDSAEQLDPSSYFIKTSESLMYRVNNLKEYNRVELKVYRDLVTLNNQQIERTDLVNFLYCFEKKYAPNFVIVFDCQDDISYERYIEYLDIIWSTTDRLRNEMSLEILGYPFEYNIWDLAYRPIKEKYPRNMVEWTPEEKRLLKLLELQNANF